MIPNPVNQRPHELSKPRASGDDPWFSSEHRLPDV